MTNILQSVKDVAKPILFNTEMVRAIMEGRKTVTRRVIKPQFANSKMFGDDYYFYGKVSDNPNDIDYGISWEKCDPVPRAVIQKAQYKVGNYLYVRETWQKTYINDGSCNPRMYKYDYKAGDDEKTVYRWRPSIHMPKEAARIFLKVTDVRVERLGDITVEQALKEGFVGVCCQHTQECLETARDVFINTFLSIYPDCNEDSWVWVYEFEQI